jgi:CelD/BcsL family acetyltransferase involved in cellulose biosynthesis
MSARQDQGVAVRVARTLEEVEALRDTWATFQNDRVTADIDFFRCVLATEPNAIRPHVVVIERDGAAEAMLVARVGDVKLPSRLGYKTVYAPTVRSINVVLGGALGTIDERNAAVLVTELRAALRRGEADVAFLRHLPVESTLYEVAAARPPRWLRQQPHARNRYWQVTLPDSFEEFNRGLSKKTRESFRRYANRFVREYGDRIEVREYRRPEQIDELVRDVEEVAAKSWQRGLGVGFVDDERTRVRTLLGLEKGWLLALVLTVDGQPVAFWMGDAYNGRFRSMIPGYDPAFSEHRVGNYVLLRLIERLCEDDAVRVLDFGFGDVEYKERLSDSSYWAGDVVLFAPNVRGIFVGTARTAITGADRGLRRVARSAGVFDRLKRGWRRRFAGGGREPGAAPDSSQRAGDEDPVAGARSG